MAGSYHSIPVSDSNNPFFLEALLHDNQSNMMTELFNNVPYHHSSLLPRNSVEMNDHSSTPIIHIPMTSDRQEYGIGPSRQPVQRCHNFRELMEPTVPSQSSASTYPFSCSSCLVLREIIHSNGLQSHKLEVHGKIGMIYHAVFHQDTLGSSSIPQIFDLSSKSLEEVKSFLKEFCLNQKSLGYFLIPDPLSAYYEALSIGYEWIELLGSSSNRTIKGKELMVVDDHSSDPLPDNPYRRRAEQNLRADGMTIHDFKDYFHLPQVEAAKRVHLCRNAVKRIMRKGGIENWPYLTIRNTMRQITRLRNIMSTDDPVTRTISQEEINRLKLKMIKACGGILPTVALDA